MKEFSIQLYSVRHEIDGMGWPAVLEKVSAIGYTGVEFAGCGSYEPEGLKALLAKYKLRPVGAHIGLGQLEYGLDWTLNYHKKLGTEYITVPSAPFANEDDIKATANKLNVLALKVREAGFRFAFHNHGIEFEPYGDIYRLERMMQLAPEVDIQLDVYWASRMGCDCAAFIKKYAPRVTSLHIKQMDAQGESVDLCDGVLDFAALIEAGRQNGVAEYIHEQEEFSGDTFTGLERGFKHIWPM